MPSVKGKPFRLGAAPPQPCSKCGGERMLVVHKREGIPTPRLICRPCHAKTSYKSRLKRAPEYNQQIAERRRSEPLFRAYEMWKGARDRARRRGIDFSLSRETVERAILVGRCEVTGLRFDLRLKAKRLGALSPSIDRKDQRLGYTEENSQFVCWLYNRAKGDGTHLDVLLLVEALGAVAFCKAA